MFSVLVVIFSALALVGCSGENKQGSARTFTDSRDKQKYRTVKIGNKTWMAQNLNFTISDSWCYDDDDSNCAKYGRLYTWDAAMKACPSGWRLPTHKDWNDLVQIAGDSAAGKKLKSKTDWDGTDEFGFSALPGGRRGGFIGYFVGVGSRGDWWGATEVSGIGRGNVCHRNMRFDIEYVGGDWIANSIGYGLSVRCLKGDYLKNFVFGVIGVL